MMRLRHVAALSLGLWLCWAGTAHANAVTVWNDIAAQAVGVGRAGPPGLLDLVLVQTAVHDAVQAIEGR